MNQNFTKLAFTDSVKKVQEQCGSRKSYARTETSGAQEIAEEIAKSNLDILQSCCPGDVE